MRVQSSFEKFSQVTTGPIFVFCLVGLRLMLGASALAVLNGMVASLTATHELAPWLITVLPVAVVILGVSFLLGVLVRPSALLMMLMMMLVIITSSGWLFDTGRLLPAVFLILVLGLFAAGGSGHMLGLDGIIFRNIRRPNLLTRFLFG